MTVQNKHLNQQEFGQTGGSIPPNNYHKQALTASFPQKLRLLWKEGDPPFWLWPEKLVVTELAFENWRCCFSGHQDAHLTLGSLGPTVPMDRLHPVSAASPIHLGSEVRHSQPTRGHRRSNLTETQWHLEPLTGLRGHKLPFTYIHCIKDLGSLLFLNEERSLLAKTLFRMPCSSQKIL